MEESRTYNILSFFIPGTEALCHRYSEESAFGEGEGRGIIKKGDIDFFSMAAKFPSPAG
jgi:hypothetical protein